METLWSNLAIGAAGSVIGAAIVYFASSAVSIGKSTRIRVREKSQLESELWKTRKIQVRMAITNYYLFEVLKALLFGTILTVIPSIGSFALASVGAGGPLWLVLAGLTCLGLVYYFVGLGQVLKYLALRRSDEDYLKTYVSNPPEA